MGEPYTLRRYLFVAGVVAIQASIIGPAMWYFGRWMGMN